LGDPPVSPSAKPLPHQHHEFLFALVDLFQVVYELGELDVSVVSHHERLPGFAQELDELAVVARADVREPRVRGVDVRPDGRVQQLPERRLVQGHQLPGVPAAVQRRHHARRGQRAPPQNVREHGGALHALDHQGDDGGQLVLPQRVAERAGPQHVVDGRVRVLVVTEVQVRHGERRQLVRPHRVAAVLHVARDGEQLRVAHPRRRRVQHNLVGGLEGNVVLFAERESGEGAVLGVLHGALQGQGAGRRRQVLLLVAVQAEADDGAVGHDGGRHDAGGLRGGEEGEPALHDAVQRVHTWQTHTNGTE